MQVRPLLAHTADIFLWFGLPLWLLPFASLILAILLGRRVSSKSVIIPFSLHLILMLAVGGIWTGNWYVHTPGVIQPRWFIDIPFFLMFAAVVTSPALAAWIMMTTKRIDTGSGSDNK